MGISSFALFALVLVGANAIGNLESKAVRNKQRRALAKMAENDLTSASASLPDILSINSNSTHILKHSNGAPYSLFGGDMFVTYEQIAKRFGNEVADSLQDSGFHFVPSSKDIAFNSDSVEPDGKRAVEVDGAWPVTYRYDGRFHIPFIIEGYSDPDAALIIKQGLDELEAETGVLKFITADEFSLLNSKGANIPDHFIKFIPEEVGLREFKTN